MYVGGMGDIAVVVVSARKRRRGMEKPAFDRVAMGCLFLVGATRRPRRGSWRGGVHGGGDAEEDAVGSAAELLEWRGARSEEDAGAGEGAHAVRAEGGL